MFAVTFEGGVKLVFWAIEQWKNQRARDRAEGRAEGLAEGLAEGRAATLQYVQEVIRPNMTEDEYDAAIKELERKYSVNGKN